MKCDVALIDRLRAAAFDDGAIYELLFFIKESISIDRNGNASISIDEDGLVVISSAIVAAEFAEYDRRDE